MLKIFEKIEAGEITKEDMITNKKMKSGNKKKKKSLGNVFYKNTIRLENPGDSDYIKQKK